MGKAIEGLLVYDCPTTGTGHNSVTDVFHVKKKSGILNLTIHCSVCNEYHVLFFPIVEK